VCRGVSRRISARRHQNKISTRRSRVKGDELARFLLLMCRVRKAKQGMERVSSCAFPLGSTPPRRDPHRHDVHASPIFKVLPGPRFFADTYTHSSIPKSTHRKQRGVSGVHFFKDEPIRGKLATTTKADDDDLPLFEL
jgi:hypothetical protein